MKTLFKNALYSFHLLLQEYPVLLFVWTDATARMTYEDFQEACSNYAGFAWQYNAKHLLVDTCQFFFQLPGSFTSWRDAELNPVYYDLGVLKFAYLTIAEFIHYMKDIPAEEGRFETRNFTSQQAALDWLNQ